MGRILDITDQNFNNEVLESKNLVLLDFYIDKCAPCEMLKPIIEQIAMEEPGIKVGKVDAEITESVVRQYDIQSVPTLVVVKGGSVVSKVSGVPSKIEILSMLK